MLYSEKKNTFFKMFVPTLVIAILLRVDHAFNFSHILQVID